ncbi:MAG TPA: hypothetical protein VK550_14225 [Polyangiaceae bacterium]|nr:hypothetical protein [Polyangiaceae bacterium]
MTAALASTRDVTGERLPLRALTAGAAVLGSVCLISMGGKK